MSIVPLHALDGLFQTYGYGVVFVCIMLESIGLPLPGESMMIAAALYAATTHHMSILLMVPIAAAGAICGDQIGYGIGRWIGYRVLVRWGRKVGVTEDRLELGRYLFRRYGAFVVFLGRFVAILRTLAAILAGANRMPWRAFFLWNALGGICWTSLYGFGAYALGDAAKHIGGPMGIVLGTIGAIAVITGLVFVKHNEHRLLAQARHEMKTSLAPATH
jgi:membrane protein DedA with SNARE-associated domain